MTYYKLNPCEGLQWNWNQNTKTLFEEDAFENVIYKKVAILSCNEFAFAMQQRVGSKIPSQHKDGLSKNGIYCRETVLSL